VRSSCPTCANSNYNPVFFIINGFLSQVTQNHYLVAVFGQYLFLTPGKLVFPYYQCTAVFI
jgi:hypothetical protein